MAVKFTTGQIVLLTDTRHGRTLRFVVEEKNRGTNYLLARPSNPYARLHVAQNGKVSYSESQPTSGSFFVLVHAGAATGDYRLQSATLSPTVCVGVQPDGSLRAHPLDPVVDGSREDADAAQQSSLCFRIGGGGDDGGAVAGVSPRPVALQPWEVRRFVAEGFVVLRGCMRRDVLRRCDRVLTRAWAVPGSVVAGGTQGDGVGKLAGAFSNCAEVRDLFLDGGSDDGGADGGGEVRRRTVLGAVEALLGPDNADVQAGSLSAQIAFRFPELGDDDNGDGDCVAALGRSWHTDGLRQGKAHPFSLLVGICLSDVVTERAGNLLVWPGSHLLLHRCKVGRHGALDHALLQQALAARGADDAHPSPPTPGPANAVIDGLTYHVNEPQDLPDLGPPHAVLARAGVSPSKMTGSENFPIFLISESLCICIGRGAASSGHGARRRAQPHLQRPEDGVFPRQGQGAARGHERGGRGRGAVGARVCGARSRPVG